MDNRLDMAPVQGFRKWKRFMLQLKIHCVRHILSIKSYNESVLHLARFKKKVQKYTWTTYKNFKRHNRAYIIEIIIFELSASEIDL